MINPMLYFGSVKKTHPLGCLGMEAAERAVYPVFYSSSGIFR